MVGGLPDPLSAFRRHVELNVVSQALFGALDLEREGQIPQARTDLVRCGLQCLENNAWCHWGDKEKAW